MSIAKLFYLTTPAPNRYVVNFQLFGSDELLSIEISKAHLTNVIIDGASLALREVHHRVPEISPTETEHDRAGA